jgi:hypothetical protein
MIVSEGMMKEIKKDLDSQAMPLSMPLSWTKSLEHLEYVMGPCWFSGLVIISGGFPFPTVLVPRCKLCLCHTPIKPDLLGFSRIDVFVCGLHDHMITRFTSPPIDII